MSDTDELVGLQVTVRRGDQVVVLDLPGHPCAAHILDDISAARRSDSVAGLVAADTSGRAPAGAAPPPPMLTSPERAVLDLVTTGYTNREIAGRLGLKSSSVKTYIRTAYRKIGVTTRAEAVRWGLDHGAGC